MALADGQQCTTYIKSLQSIKEEAVNNSFIRTNTIGFWNADFETVNAVKSVNAKHPVFHRNGKIINSALYSVINECNGYSTVDCTTNKNVNCSCGSSIEKLKLLQDRCNVHSNIKFAVGNKPKIQIGEEIIDISDIKSLYDESKQILSLYNYNLSLNSVTDLLSTYVKTNIFTEINSKFNKMFSDSGNSTETININAHKNEIISNDVLKTIANHINNYYSDCLCYTDCIQYSICYCYGNCSYY